MKTVVLIPSHIYYPDQVARLDTCLESLCSQTIVPDIFVSISFANDTYKRELSTLLRKYSTVKFKLAAQQKFQMEHLMTLLLFIGDYDMVMFCDDDDTYLPMRVEEFVKVFEITKEHCVTAGKQFGGVREVKGAEDAQEEAPEYWAYGIPPSLLFQFFERIKGYEDLMRHKFADMYLRSYLKRTGGTSMMFGCIFATDMSGLTMYQYTIDNPNSICERHMAQTLTEETVIPIIRDNVTLGLICDRSDLVEKHMRAASAPLSKLNRVVPDTDRIKRLIKILYK